MQKLKPYLMFLLSTSITNCITHQEAFDIGNKSYAYAYPLMFMSVARNIMLKQSSINQFNRISTAWLDVSKSPVILSVPENPKVEITDTWMNTVLFPAGSKTYAFVEKNWQSDLPKAFKKIIAPTNNLYLKIAGNADEYRLSTWKNSFDIDEPCWSVSEFIAPEKQIKNMDAKTFFGMFAHELKNNPPQKINSKILKQLKKIGFEIGKDFDARKLPMEILKSLELGMEQARKEMHDQSNLIKRTFSTDCSYSV
jgi:hypothetical protein